MRTSLICLMALVGCAHTTQPPPTSPLAPDLPLALPQEDIRVEPTKPPVVTMMPCGENTQVHVGKLDILMPKGAKWEMDGVKADLNPYHVVLEDVTFNTQHTCLIQ